MEIGDMIIYPLVMTNLAIENDPVEIVDVPIENGGSFNSYVSHYQRVICRKLKLLKLNFHRFSPWIQI